jgi:hypothetical protein
MPQPTAALEALIEAELLAPSPEAVHAIAAAARERHGDGIEAVATGTASSRIG